MPKWENGYSSRPKRALRNYYLIIKKYFNLNLNMKYININIRINFKI